MRIWHENIRNELNWAKEQYKLYYDKKRTEAPNLQEGSRVYLKRRTTGQKQFNIKTGKKATKLEHLQLGPFRIKRKLDYDNYELELPVHMKIHPIVHISLLKPTSNPETTEDVTASDDVYEVEAIKGKRTRHGIVEYLVKWTGYGDMENTWEPVKNLNCPEKVHEYNLGKEERRIFGTKI
jgi:hypothetical protein